MTRAFLREATEEDIQALWIWRNDPQTVVASLSKSKVGWEEHVRWFRDVLCDRSRDLLILQEGDEAIGMIRLDQDDETAAEVSINIAPEHRGEGLGAGALALAVQWAKARGIPVLRAQVRAENDISLRAFARAGFAERERLGDVVTLVKNVADH